MNGSEKQIKWAEDIKSGIDFHPEGLTGVGQKVLEWIEGIPDASWWIENRDLTGAADIIPALMNGILIGNKKYILTRKGQMMKKWNEIVSDGKGGYKEAHEELVIDFTKK